MSFKIRSPIANKLIEDGEYEVCLYEKCSYEWNVDDNSLPDQHPIACCGKSSTDVKYSPIFSASNPVCTWYLVLKKQPYERFNLSLVLRSADGVKYVDASYDLELFSHGNLHDTIKTRCMFTAGQASPTIKLSRNYNSYISDVLIKVTVRAEVSKIELKRNDIFYPDARDKLISDLSSMMSKGINHDINIKVTSGNTPITIPAHRDVLAARSPVFAAMMEHDMLERNHGCVEVTDFKASAVKEMISFMYTGTVRELTVDLASELLKLSDKYDVPDLREVCETHLVNEINASTAADILYLADDCNVERLKEKAILFISENFDTFNENGGFKEFNTNRKRLINDVIAVMARTLKKLKK